MGFQNSTYPIAVYGCLDTCSRKVLWVKVWRSNSDPKLIGRFYLEYLYEQRTIASMLRVDKGMETGVMATMHAYLRQQHGDMDAGETVLFGPSTSNQVEYICSNIRPSKKIYMFHVPARFLFLGRFLFSFFFFAGFPLQISLHVFELSF